MNRFLKFISTIMLIIAVVIATGCTKPDDSNNGGNGNNNGNNGETPEASSIISTSEVQYEGRVFIEAVFEDESKMYFEILSPNEVTFGNSVSEIEGHAFEGCDKLLEINLPNAISYIGSYAFWTDLNVIDTTIVSCMALTPPIIDSDVFLGRWNLLIYVPVESVDAYKAADGWREYEDKIIGI